MDKLNQLLMEVKGLLCEKDREISRLRQQVELSRLKIIQLADELTSAQRTIKRLQ